VSSSASIQPGAASSRLSENLQGNRLLRQSCLTFQPETPSVPHPSESSILRATSAYLALAPVRLQEALRTSSSFLFARARNLDSKRATCFALAAVALALAADPALAQAGGGGTDISTFLQNLVNLITGTAGKLLAVLAICIVGITALLGGLSMRTAGSVLFGILLIFSSAWLVDQLVA
jgi:type IV secretory pathway VirB2 component (pilin)